MEPEDKISAKLNALFKTITDFPGKLAEAIQDGFDDSRKLTCVKQGKLDFGMIEEDIAEMHQTLRERGDQVLGTKILIDDTKNSLRIVTYVKREEKTFSISAESVVDLVTNIPSDILEELKSRGKVELFIKL